MINFIKDILPKISRYSKKLDDETILNNKHWVLIDTNGTSKVVYIFRPNNDLLISVNGKVDKGKWTCLPDEYLLIEKTNGNFLYKHGFFDDTLLALKRDGTLDFEFYVNETKIGKELNNLESILEYLDKRYIRDLFPPGTEEEKKQRFTDDLNPVCNDSLKWGYCNPSGELVIPYSYDSAYRFINEYAIVVINDKYGMIDKSGNFLIHPTYDYLEQFSDGVALAKLNRKFGYIDKDQKIRFEFIYDDADIFESGKAKVKINGKTSFLTIE